MPFTEKYIRPLAVAVIRYQGKILAVRGVDHVKNEVFFRLPGGGIEFGETAEAALKREFAEEFGVEVKIGRRLDVTENVFSYEGRAGHEIVFVFEAYLPYEKSCFPEGLPFAEPGMEGKFAEWITVAPDVLVYPEAVRQIRF